MKHGFLNAHVHWLFSHSYCLSVCLWASLILSAYLLSELKKSFAIFWLPEAQYWSSGGQKEKDLPELWDTKLAWYSLIVTFTGFGSRTSHF